MNILMLAPLKKENFEKVENTFPQYHFIYSTASDVTQDMIDGCDIIVGNPGNQVDFNRANIKAIFLNSAGSDAYIEEGKLHKNTILTNASGTYGNAIAEHTLGMILTLNKNIHQYVRHMKDGLWQPLQTGKELYKSTVLIIGLGDLGYEIAKRLKSFHCKVIGVKRNMCALPQYIDELYTIERLDDLLPLADFVILTLPQTPQTIHLMDKNRLRKMKKDAVLVNVGRGSAICTHDLIEVLKQDYLYGVALDVVEEEPLSIDHELWTFDNVIITPHSSGGYVWESTREYFTNLVIRNIKHYINNEVLENEVDFQTGYRKCVVLKGDE